MGGDELWEEEDNGYVVFCGGYGGLDKVNYVLGSDVVEIGLNVEKRGVFVVVS